jgi:hypothetical protein
LGYQFNPVSFWYLYSDQKKLKAMILEVNNTFDERHMYFLKPEDNEIEGVPEEDVLKEALDDSHVQADKGVNERPGKPTRFTNTWSKEFHVSPFNSRKGSYSLIAYDPLYPNMTGTGPIDNTITLQSSKSHAKLVARVFSAHEAVDPASTSLVQRMKFLALWWWVGFVTFPRIVREAGKLFFRRKLHVWFRPEPLSRSLSRHADSTETQLETFFRKYLQHLVKVCSAPIQVRYISAGLPDSPPELMLSPSARLQPEAASTLEFKVVTPIFYTRFIHYAHDLEAFFSELNENGTISLSDPSLLPKLVIKAPLPTQITSSRICYYALQAIQHLRRRPDRIPVPGKPVPASDGVSKVDIRNFRLSGMDGFVLSTSNESEQWVYIKEVLRVFISERVALGAVQLLDMEIFLLRVVAAWCVARSANVLFRKVAERL